MNYQAIPGTIILVITFLIGITSAAFGGGDRPGIASSGGYFAPVGSWKQHRYGSNIDQFGGGLHVTIDLEVPINPNLGMALLFQYVTLSTEDWEEYVRQQGEEISAKAYMSTFALLIRPCLMADNTHKTKFELGTGIMLSSAKEKYGDLTYNYDFFGPVGFTFLTGLEHEWYFDENFAFIARIGLLYVPGGIQYADGLNRSILGFPLSAGIRFFL